MFIKNAENIEQNRCTKYDIIANSKNQIKRKYIAARQENC